MLTQEKLKEVLCYAPDTGIFTWKINTCRSQTKIGDSAGSRSNGYLEICINQRRYKAHRLAWLYTHGYFPENQIDHIDRNPANNSIKNLREVSQVCNNRNTGNPKRNTSGVKGVWFCKVTKKWAAEIKILGKKIFLGRHKDFAEAVCHRLAAEQAENWDGCDSSSPAYKFVKHNICRSI
jgi:HNH endonuclease